MYQAVILIQYGLFKKVPAGSVNTYNNLDKYIKIIDGIDEEDCKKKVENFLHDNEFAKLGEKK